MRGHRGIIGSALLAGCAWCGWVSGFRRTTPAAEITWLITLVSVALFDVALWRGRRDEESGWHVAPRSEPWPRLGRGGTGPALRGLAPWLALIVLILAWEVLGIDTGPHQYHLTISALAQAYRPLNAALLLVWVLIGIGYGVARARVPMDGDPARREAPRPAPPGGGGGGTFAMVMGSSGVHPGAALLLPQSPPAGVAFWVCIPLAALAIDWSARRSDGRRADAEEFMRFISTAPAARYALMAAWVVAGYHLFAR